MKTYQIEIDGTTGHCNQYLTKEEADQRLLWYTKRFTNYITDSRYEKVRLKSINSLESMKIVENPEPTDLDEAKCLIASLWTRYSKSKTSCEKLEDQLKDQNKDANQQYMELAKAFNNESNRFGSKFFMTQMGPFIVEDKCLEYIANVKKMSVDEAVGDLVLQNNWNPMYSNLYSLNNVICSMIDGTYDPREFSDGFEVLNLDNGDTVLKKVSDKE